MIEELNIKNFAIIDDITLEPAPGVNVITGETGAGKSILLDALSFLFGETALDSQRCRQGAGRLEVSVSLRLENSRALNQDLEELGLDSGRPETPGIFLVRRIFDAQAGKTRAFVNDTPVAAKALKILGRYAVAMQNPASTARLFSDRFAQEYLDGCGVEAKELVQYRKTWQVFARVKSELEKHQSFIRENISRLDFLRFQLEELESAHLNPELLRRIEQELPLYMSRESVAEAMTQVGQLLDQGENPAAGLIARAKAMVDKILQRQLERRDLRLMAENLSQAQALVESASREAASLLEALEYDPATLEELLAAKAKADRVVTKHKLSGYAEIPSFHEQLRKELRALETADHQGAALTQELRNLEDALKIAACGLSAARGRAGARLSRSMNEELDSVGLTQASFEVHLEVLDGLGPEGGERARFLFAPNPGEGARELSLIASSGEASRLMLALLSVRAEDTGWVTGGTLVFDEIEQGLSAKMASVVARKLSLLSSRYQLLVITHSPVLASIADTHFTVSKKVSSARTVVQVRRLSSFEERRREAFRLLGATDRKEEEILRPYVEALFEKIETKSGSRSG